VAPYRTEEREARAEAPRDPGIVGDVIAQFADPLAFFRELVQNAIDAGTEAVEVRLEHDAGAALMRASVRDRGEGMTREVLENQLLVLFRSTKERDATKIGKFGIGFASVLAPAPRIVIVQTARDGRRLTLHLHPDLTYQLYDGGAASQPGTTVQLELAMPVDRAVAFAQRSRAALVRWCRHATVPIQLDAEVAGAGLTLSERIDRPLAIEGALVEVRGTDDGDRLAAVVGVLPAGAAPYAGFFNHGLMLHEAEEPLLSRLAVKIQDPRLGHTLSRDNVRRDDRFEHAVGFARQLAERQLPAAAAAALRDAAEAEDRARYHALAAAIGAAGVELRAAEWSFPLVDPVAGERAISGAALGRRAWSAAEPSALTAALAGAGIPVLHQVIERAQHHGCRVVPVDGELTWVRLVEPAPGEAALLDALGGLLAAAHRAPAQLWLGSVAGACGGQLAVAGGPEDAIHAPAGPGAPFVIDRAAATRSPFAMLRRAPLVLAVAHPLVAAACRHPDPALAASHLARAVLLHYRLLDVARSEEILSRVLARLEVT
jgi:molecular chaperone HtpG